MTNACIVYRVRFQSTRTVDICKEGMCSFVIARCEIFSCRPSFPKRGAGSPGTGGAHRYNQVRLVFPDHCSEPLVAPEEVPQAFTNDGRRLQARAGYVGAPTPLCREVLLRVLQMMAGKYVLNHINNMNHRINHKQHVSWAELDAVQYTGTHLYVHVKVNDTSMFFSFK